MASAIPSTDAEEAATCPICLDWLGESVSVDCGHNFCRDCITQYCETWMNIGPLECPVCKVKIQKENFRPNWQLASIVERLQLLSRCLGRNNLCARHNEPLHLFCKEDQELVCLLCERSSEHRTHTLLLLEDAAKEYKDQFFSCLEILRKEKEILLANKENTEKESRELLKQIETETEKRSAVFSQLHRFLEEQERLFLAQVEELEKEIASRRDEHMAQLLKELSSLDALIRQLEEKWQQPAGELLQDVRGTLERHEKRETIGYSAAFSASLIRKSWDICNVDLHQSFLDRLIKQYKDTVVPEPPLQKVFHGDMVEDSPEAKAQSSKSPPEETGNVRSLPGSVQGAIAKLQSALPGAAQGPDSSLVPRRRRENSGYKPANVTLDPDTAHPRLLVSEDRKSVRRGDQRPALPKNPARFEKLSFVLACEGFTTGRHFWEVDVGGGGIWAVGVARKTVKRKGKFEFGPDEGIWAVAKWGGEYRDFRSSGYSAVHLKGALQRIRVSLNCDKGWVGFLNADTGVQVLAYSEAALSRETLLPFFYVGEGSGNQRSSLQISPLSPHAACPMAARPCRPLPPTPAQTGAGLTFSGRIRDGPPVE